MAVTRLNVVNDCLAIMGEAPLNALTEVHTYKDGAIQTLNRVMRTVLADDWWFSMEDLTLMVNPEDHRIYFPSDMGTFLPIADRPNIVQRGRMLYDLQRGTDRFPDGTVFKVKLRRALELDMIPDSVANYIARRTVLEFQQLYDGDQTKTRNLILEVYGNDQTNQPGLRGEAKAEHIRNRKVNLIDSSIRVQRVRNTYRRLN